MGRTDIVGVVTVPMASPDGGSGVAFVLVQWYPNMEWSVARLEWVYIALHFGVLIGYYAMSGTSQKKSKIQKLTVEKKNISLVQLANAAISPLN